MATYVTSDIHGEYDMFLEILEKIDLKDEDTLYILGDVLDRGPKPITALLKIMEMKNAVCIVGNHEVMALKCLGFLLKEITEVTLDEFKGEKLEDLLTWMINGCQTTIDEFAKLSLEDKQRVIDFLREFEVYEWVTAEDSRYLLVHAGLGGFRPDKDMEEYSLDELVWERPDYDTGYFDDIQVITGHTPTQLIDSNPRPGFIYRKNNHIAIDCGSYRTGGRLAAICLETGEEFYSSEKAPRDDF
ncbi:MAG: metallophosphoesterase [Lachnospiraceae bacterium]|nr:metallophosphoesterase [Lachnospiraceae bacterium]